MFRTYPYQERSEARESHPPIRLSDATVEQARALISHDLKYPRCRER